MQRTNQSEEQYKLDRQTARQEKLKAKFQAQSFSEEWRSLFYIVIAATVLFQFASLLTAITLPASWIHNICHSWSIGFAIAFAFLLLLEVVKRLIISKAVKNGYQYGRWLSFGIFAGLMLSVASIASSTLGTPILIREFGAAPTLADTTAMNATYLASVASTKIYWQALIDGANQDAKKTHDQNSWKGKTTRSARPVVLQYQKKAQGYQDSLTNALSILAQNHQNSLLEIETENSDTLTSDQAKKAQTGYILGFITFGLELLFLLCTFWKEYFDYREALELSKVPAKSGESTVKSNQKPIENKSAIGFFGEGHILNKAIAYKKADGSLKYYKAYQLSSMISDAEKRGKPEQAQKFRELREKLVNA